MKTTAHNQYTNTSSRPWMSVSLLCTAFFMVVTDSTSVYAALPSIQEVLEFPLGGAQWVITIYALTFGGFLLLGGRVADFIGRRLMFMAGVGLFIGSALLCGLAWSGDVLIIARTIQGISGAMMTPAALSILMNTFEDGPDRNKALGIWGALGGIGATGGLLIGGPVTEWLGWEWIFFINIPIGLIVLILSPILLEESQSKVRKKTFDFAGAVTITVSLLVLVYAIVRVPVYGWGNIYTITFFIAAFVLLIMFVGIEQRSETPLVPLSIFKSRTLLGGNLVVLAAGMSVDGMLYIFTLYSQQVLGYSAMQFGFTMTIMTLLSVAGVSFGQHFVTRSGFRIVAATGMFLIGLSCVILSFITPNGAFWIIFTGLSVFGIGMGAAFVASQIAALANVSEEESGLASGIEETSFSIGGALGIAILAAVAGAYSNSILAASSQPDSITALTEGFRVAFGAAIIFALAGMGAALAFLKVPQLNFVSEIVPEPEEE